MGFFNRKNKIDSNSYYLTTKAPSEVEEKGDLLNSSLKDNLEKIINILGESSDIVIREIQIGKNNSVKAGIIYTSGLTDTTSLQNFIMESMMLDIQGTNVTQKLVPEPNLIEVIKNSVMTVADIKDLTDFEGLFNSLLSGDTIFLVDGYTKGLVIDNKHWEERGVTEPAAQTVVRGSREAFSENIRTNTALIRRKIKDPNLWLETKVIGTYTKTNVAIMYINGIVNEEIVKEVHIRLDRIDIDGILEGGNIEELIEDSTNSPFPTVSNTERPDAVAGSLLEGRIAILIDGSPFVLVVPTLFVQFFQSPEDYYQRPYIASLIRLLRFVSYAIALLTPALFIALTTYHQEMIPTAFLMNLAAQREGVPFPAFVETVIVEVTFEILREAGVRMPRSIGPTMSIVGAFVLGTAAVEAGTITAATVIVVSVTAIATYVTPSYDISIAVRMLRFFLIALAASFGLFGIIVGLLAIILHLCSLRSFGIPYMSPLAPFNASDQKDTYIRLPLWKMITRPRLISQKNIVRQQVPSSAKPEANKE
ncbi:spore germination protein [Paenisporosarcina antarctica]|uniref:Spore germination protein n=1 Tax=Paenisporosarcina antarctica TaxID=417367 RepID=A0A4P7A1W0_9BACL|nr:spore germination protein [Paenisporosarcina antarctica]QBP42862.1 spore germination protein [Paenisporosarcina antarctica]